MFSGHQPTRRLMRVVAYLVQRDQLVRERIRGALGHGGLLVLEADRIVQVGGPLRRQLMMVLQAVQVRWHRVDRREGRVACRLRYAAGVVAHRRRDGRDREVTTVHGTVVLLLGRRLLLLLLASGRLIGGTGACIPTVRCTVTNDTVRRPSGGRRSYHLVDGIVSLIVGRLVRETLVAGVALVRFVRLVAARVRLQVGQLRERFEAARVPTLVRFVAGVRPDVLLQMGELGELALADLAPVRLDAEMDARVLGQIARVGERLIALGAFVGFRFAHVNLRVQLQVRLGGEDLQEELEREQKRAVI
uniref:Uncharacterized protein n=1 Tax=Anopheles coluzzii TaxID=1518534 RepID=A0A8W7Q298_ANOCL